MLFLCSLAPYYIQSTRLSFRGSRGCWSQSQLSLGERRGTPWTGRQSVTGLTYRDGQPLTFTPTGNLESPINLICMSLDCGRKPEHPEKTHAGTRRTCKLHTVGRWVRTLLLHHRAAPVHVLVIAKLKCVPQTVQMNYEL